MITANQINDILNDVQNKIDKFTSFYKLLNKQLNETQSYINDLTYKRKLYENVINEGKQSLFNDDILRDDGKQDLFALNDNEIAAINIKHIDKQLKQLNANKKIITSFMHKTKKQIKLGNALQTAIINRLIEQSLFEE